MIGHLAKTDRRLAAAIVLVLSATALTGKTILRIALHSGQTISSIAGVSRPVRLRPATANLVLPVRHQR